MQAVTGVFKSQDQADNAVKQLRSLGIPDKRIGIVRPGSAPERLEAGVPVSDTEEPGMGKAMGAAVGGAMGAAGGATAGLAACKIACARSKTTIFTASEGSAADWLVVSRRHLRRRM